MMIDSEDRAALTLAIRVLDAREQVERERTGVSNAVAFLAIWEKEFADHVAKKAVTP